MYLHLKYIAIIIDYPRRYQGKLLNHIHFSKIYLVKGANLLDSALGCDEHGRRGRNVAVSPRVSSGRGSTLIVARVVMEEGQILEGDGAQLNQSLIDDIKGTRDMSVRNQMLRFINRPNDGSSKGNNNENGDDNGMVRASVITFGHFTAPRLTPLHRPVPLL